MGGATQISDANALIVELNTTGKTSLNAGGALTLSGSVSGSGSDLTTVTTNGGSTHFGPRVTSVDGSLLVVGGGGPVTQTEALIVLDLATFDAGLASVILPHPNNRFKTGTEIKAGDYSIVGDARRDAARALEAALSTRVSAATSSSGVLATATPQPLVITAASAATGTSSSATNASAAASNNSGIMIDLSRAETTAAVTIAAVSLPKGTSTAGTGFSFVLPDAVSQAATANAGAVRATTPQGSALPTWLKFDAKTMQFQASAVPDGAFPMQVTINIGTQRIMVVISERTSD